MADETREEETTGVPSEPPAHMVEPEPPEEDRDVAPPEPEPSPKPVPEAKPARDPLEALISPPTPTPTVPDAPGGQVATVDGKKQYIEGSTMRELGFHTPEEYSEAQSAGVSHGVHEGSRVPEVSSLVRIRQHGKWVTVRYSGEKDGLSQSVLTGLRKGDYLVPIVIEGKKKYFTKEEMDRRWPGWTQMAEFQMEAARYGMEAWARKSQQYEFEMQAYENWVASFRATQKAAGYSDKRIDEQLIEIETSRYQAYSPEVRGFVPTYREVYEQVELAGYLPKEIDEIYSGKFMIPVPGLIEPVAVTKKQYYDYRVQQKTLTELRGKGYATEVGKLRPGEIGPIVPEEHKWNYNLVGALDAGFDRKKLVAVFGEDIVKESEQLSADIKLLERYGSIEAMKASKDKGVADAGERLDKLPKYLPGEEIVAEEKEIKPVLPSKERWMNVRTGERYTDREKTRLLQLRPTAEAEIVRTPESVKEEIRTGYQRLVTAPFRGEEEIGVTFIGDKRVDFRVSTELKASMDTVAAFLRVYGGGVDKSGRTLEQQMTYLASLSKEDFIKDYFEDKGWEYGINRGTARQWEIVRHDKRLQEASEVASGPRLAAIDMVSLDLRKSMLRLGNMVSLISPEEEINILKEPLASIPTVLYAAGTLLPIIGTALTWNRSSPVIRGLNIAIDIAIMFPFMKVGLRNAINALNKATKPGKAAINELRIAEKQAAQEMAKVLKKTYGKDVADAFNNVHRVQSEYIASLYDLIRLEGKGLSIVKAQAKAEAIAARLATVARKYRDILKKAGGFDDSLTLTVLDEMPGQIVRNTQVAVRETIAKAVGVKGLRKALTDADARLISMQKVSTTSNKNIKSLYDTWQSAGGNYGTLEHRAWVIAVKRGEAIDKQMAEAFYKQAMAQSRLEKATVQSASNIGTKLATRRAELIELQKRLTRAEFIEARGGHTEPPAYLLRDRVKKLQVEVLKLESEYNNALKKLSTEMRVKYEKYVIWGPGYKFSKRMRWEAVPEEPLAGGVGRIPLITSKAEVSPSLMLAMRLAGRARVPTRAGAPARAPLVRPPLADAVSETALSTIKTTWKMGDEEFTRISPMVREAIMPIIAPLIREIISPAEAAAMTPAALRAIEEAIEAAIKAAIKAAIEGKTKAQIEAATRAAIRSAIKAITDPAIKSRIKAQTKPLTKPAVKVATAMATKLAPLRPLRPKPPKKKPPLRPPLLETPISEGKIPKKIPAGSVTWAMGMFWKYIPPPYNQRKPITLSAPPIGAVNTGSNKPKDTIQVIGKASGVPRRIDVDLGWVDITIVNGRVIEFKGGGEDTNTGTRIDSPTMGMDLDEGFVDVPVAEVRSSHRIVRKKPKKRTHRADDISDLTSFSGIRYR